MNRTPARARFKAHLGQANHFLVTSLIALHTLDESDVVAAPDILHTSWNPQNRENSIARSRVFVLKSFLGWAVDSIDMYISLLDRKPTCLQDTKLSRELQDSKVSRSVHKKVRIIGTNFEIDSAILSLIDVLITWRNNVFHEASDNFVHETTNEALTKCAAQIASSYRGLNVSNLAAKAEAGEGMTFKESASLISAAQHFVRDVDDAVLQALDVERYCVEAVQGAIDDREQRTGFRAKYLGLDLDRRAQFVSTWLRNEYGCLLPKEQVPKKVCELERRNANDS